MLKRITVIFLCTPLICLLLTGDIIRKKKIYGICTRVLDGDTLIVNEQKIRLAFLDAPELKQYSYDGKPIGQKAKRELQKLVLDKKITVTYAGRGKYGRIIGQVWVGNLDVNLALIVKGHAVLYGLNFPTEYKAREYLAKIKGHGIFGTQGFDMPFHHRKKKRGLNKGPLSYKKMK